ncbi:hypothetical protein LUZ60_013684 [Juncus effusus]|nr:hypothetical protein LUZ60_013684 [Juncus effusus]
MIIYQKATVYKNISRPRVFLNLSRNNTSLSFSRFAVNSLDRTGEKMSDAEEYRCFIGNLSWTTTDSSLEDAFSKFGKISDAKVVMDKFSGRSRGFGFVTFDEKEDMEEAIEKMNGGDLDGRSITVDRAQPGGGGGRDRGDRGDRGGDRDYDRRDRGGDRRGGGGGDRRGGGGGGDCFKCGKPGHFARECPDSGGDRYGGRDDRYGGGGGGGSRYSGGPDRNGGSRGGGDRYGGGGGSRNGGGGGGRDRSGPYGRPRS